MNKRKLIYVTVMALLLVFFLSPLFLSSVSAQASGDWNISGDWSSPTPIPTASPSPTQTLSFGVLGALGLCSVLPTVLAGVLIVVALKRGLIDHDAVDARFVVVTIASILTITIVLDVMVIIVSDVAAAF